MQHTAIFGKNLSVKSNFIKQLLWGNLPEYFAELNGERGVLYSNYTLNQFIDEEERHEDFILSGEEQRSIRTFSTGEQRKALLNYLVSKKPPFIVLDNPFDALDAESQVYLLKKLERLSEQIIIIQLFKRKTDLLPFIKRAIELRGEQVLFNGTVADWLNKHEQLGPMDILGKIPPPIVLNKTGWDTLVEFNGVLVSYEGRCVLNNIKWHIKPGEFWQLVGPNGSGKTTLLTMINGDNPKAYGQPIKLFGRQKGSGENVWQIKKQIGYFTPSMMDLFKARNNALQMVISGLVDSVGLYQNATELQVYIAEEWLRLLGLYEIRKKLFQDLSQINQRLVLVARAMIKHPPLLILDEPSNGLDDAGALLLTELINKMAEESTTAILYVSHRREPGLSPQKVFKLTPTNNGSVGSTE